MKYLWTEDTGAGLHFWKLVNQLFFDNVLVSFAEINSRKVRREGYNSRYDLF